MNIEVKIDKNYENPQILILTNQMTSELSVIIDKISNITQETLQTYKDQKLYILGQNEIESIYSENGKVYVRCSNEIYSTKNRLYEIEKTKQDNALANERKSQIGSGDRSEKIRTYNYPQGRITDHRIGLSIFQMEDFLNGNLDNMIDSLTAAHMAEKLKGNEEE